MRMHFIVRKKSSFNNFLNIYSLCYKFTITEANKNWSYRGKEEKMPNSDHGNWKRFPISTGCLPAS